MNVQSRRLAGILLVVLPTVVIGGVSLLSLLIWEPAYAANPLRQDLWRAGHAHAGVLLVLSLIVLRYVDEARFSEAARWFVRLSVPAAAILLPAAFFLSVLSPTAQQPNGIIYLAFVGAALLAAGVLTLGVGLIRGGKPTRTEVNSMTDTFLPYIEKPERLIMKLVYFFYAPTIRQGAYTAEGSCRAIADRLRNVLRKSEPTGQKLTLPPELVMLIRHQVARINICLFCIDIARSFTIKASMNQAKFDALDEYGTSPVFNDAERAGARLCDGTHEGQEGQPEDFHPHVAALLRARTLRDRLARCQRASLQT